MFGSWFYSLSSDSPEEAGAFGEMIVNNTMKLKKYQDIECYLFKDVYIDGPDRVNQIDHIFILKTGIFVVETKMFSNGKVNGTDNDEMWFYNKKPFLNPIIQNESHVRALRKLIGDSFNIIPLVVFAWNNKPKTCKNQHVLNYSEFIDYPLNYIPDKELSSDDMKHICYLLTENEKIKPELKLKHREQLKKAKGKRR